MTEPSPDGGWDPRADWEAQVKAAREARAQATGDVDAGPDSDAPLATETALATDAPRPTETERPTETAPEVAAETERDMPAQTVPLVPFTPFTATVAPVAPATGPGAGQAGQALATAKISPAKGMTGILGQDHLRGALRPPRSLFPRLSLAERHRWWIWRAGSALVAGGLAAMLTSWPAGLIAGGLVLAGGALFSYRSSPALSPAARASSARRRTRRRLARLGPAGYLTLHGRAIPGTDQVIDHLVVGPAGIYAVDSEVWDRRLPVRATRGGKLFHGPRDQAARLEHARWEAGQAARLIGAALGQPITARPAMVIYGPAVPWIVVRISGVDVFCGRQLRKYLRREASGGSRYLDERQVEAIHEIAAQVLPPAG